MGLWLWALPGWGQTSALIVEDIAVEGVRKTKELVVLRQMTIQPGDTIAAEALDQIRNTNTYNIYNLTLFNDVKITEEISGDRIYFTVRVKERWYIFPQPYAALAERTFNEWWEDKDLDRLVYGLGVEWKNVSGWNDRMYLYAQNGYTRRLSLQFTRPFLFPQAQIDGSFGVFLSNDKEIGYNTVDGVLQLARLQESRIRTSFIGTATFSKRFGPRRQLQFNFGYLYYHLQDSIRIFNPRYLTRDANEEYYPTVGISWVEDQRDWHSFPLEGLKYSASVRLRGLPGLGTTRFVKATLSFSHHLPLSKRWNFAYGTQNFFLFGDRVPYYDKFFVGLGNSFLRGYEYFVIDGSFVNLTKAEWKFALLPRRIVHVPWIPFRRFQDFPVGLYISAYSDAGYVSDRTFNNQDNYLKDRWLLGYGVGLNLITVYDSLFRLEYSRNLLGFGGIYLSAIVSIQ